jgi:carbonic anhydrase
VVPNLITTTAPVSSSSCATSATSCLPPRRWSAGALGGVSSAIEYAVEVLEVGSVIVCGHTNCGAIDAILHPERVAHLPLVARWLREAGSIPTLIEERDGHLEREAKMIAAVEENILLQLEHLRSFEIVQKRLAAGKLSMSGWVFNIAKGEVFDYDPETEQFPRVGVDGDERPALSSRPPPPVAPARR